MIKKALFLLLQLLAWSGVLVGNASELTDSVQPDMVKSDTIQLSAQERRNHGLIDRIVNNRKIKVDTTQDLSFLNERVIVGNDTISIVLPQRNYGRYDRGLYNFLFIPKGQWSIGLTASYGEFSTDDFSLLNVLNDFDIKLKAYSIKPSVSYFFNHNQSLGVRFDYTKISADLNNMTFDFDEDLNFSLSGVSYYSQSYTASIFYRNYLGLGRNKRFAIFNEVALSFGSGSSRFLRTFNSEPRDTRTTVTKGSLDFSPGLCVFIQEYVSFNISFGVFGLNMRHETQHTDGEPDGSRWASGANFRFNIFNIAFGMGIHI